MQKHKRYTSLFLILLAAFTSCKRDVLPATNPNFPQLYGTWNWVWTSGGFSGGGYSPATAGYSCSVEFDDNGTCIHFKNGQQTEKTYYTITQGTSFLTGQPTHFIKYINPGKQKKNAPAILQSLRFSGNDSLFISDEADDGYETLYVKK